jgi:hypothetical protein
MWSPQAPLVLFLSLFVVFLSSVIAFEVPILDTGKSTPRLQNRPGISVSVDYSRQICSGMWGGPSAYINGNWTHPRTKLTLNYGSVSFDSTSQGQLAMVIYEWKDAKYLGKVQHSDADNELPVSS